jgi:hypothetical protein
VAQELLASATNGVRPPACGRAVFFFPFQDRHLADPPRFSVAEFPARVRDRLAAPGDPVGDHSFNRRSPPCSCASSGGRPRF